MNNSTEIERLKTALALTRDHNLRLAEENKRLRAGTGLPPSSDVVVTVHPEFMSPPPAPPPKVRIRRGIYDGDKPLRTQWPLEP